MSKRDFFIIIVKLLGLYAFITTSFSVISHIFELSTSRVGFNTDTFIYTLGYFAFLFFLIIVLLKQADKVVHFLKLDKGFDSDIIQIEKLDKAQVVQLGLIIVGGLIFLEHLPKLLSNCFYLLKSIRYHDEIILNYTQLTDFIAAALGYYVLKNSQKIAKKLL